MHQNLKRRASTSEEGPPNKIWKREVLGMLDQNAPRPRTEDHTSTVYGSHPSPTRSDDVNPSYATYASQAVPAPSLSLPPGNTFGDDSDRSEPYDASASTLNLLNLGSALFQPPSTVITLSERREPSRIKERPDIVGVLQEVRELETVKDSDGKDNRKLALCLTDQSMGGETFTVTFFKPVDYSHELPPGDPDDIILIRRLKVDKHTGSICGTAYNDTIWDLFKADGDRHESVVESSDKAHIPVGDEELEYIGALRKWWDVGKPPISIGPLKNKRMDLPLSSIASILHNAGPTDVYRLRARVTDYGPLNIRAFVEQFCLRCKKDVDSRYRICPAPSHGKQLVFPEQRWKFHFDLQDESGKLHVMCCRDDAAAFLGGLPAQSLMEDYCPTLDSLRTRLRPLIGDVNDTVGDGAVKEQKDASGEWADWCVQKRGDRRWVVCGQWCHVKAKG